ncbi:hypothetical protein Tco_1530567 [Tanacetum coccineum]
MTRTSPFPYGDVYHYAKEAESSKEPLISRSVRTASYSKGASRSQPTDLNETTHLEFITGHDDVIPVREVQDERQWHPLTSPTPDREWHLTKTSTSHRFSDFMINRLKIDHLTQDLLTGPTYDLIKAQESVAVISIKIMKFFGYSHLEEITVRRQDDVLYKFREGDFKRLRRQDIEDMLLLLVQGKLTNLIPG